METAYKVICNVMEKTIVVMDPMREDVVSIKSVHSWMRRCDFSAQYEKENTEVEEKSIDKFYKKYNCCFWPNIEVLDFLVSYATAAPQLRRSSPPRLVEQMRQKEVKLICNVSDAKNYIWYKDERKIHLPSDRYFVKSHWYLQITDVLKSDSATFVCLASNSYGKLNCTVRLIVEGKSFWNFEQILNWVCCLCFVFVSTQYNRKRKKILTWRKNLSMSFIKWKNFVYDPTLNIFENFTCLSELFFVFVFL